MLQNTDEIWRAVTERVDTERRTFAPGAGQTETPKEKLITPGLSFAHHDRDGGVFL